MNGLVQEFRIGGEARTQPRPYCLSMGVRVRGLSVSLHHVASLKMCVNESRLRVRTGTPRSWQYLNGADSHGVPQVAECFTE